jgi:hypothetical protein
MAEHRFAAAAVLFLLAGCPASKPPAVAKAAPAATSFAAAPSGYTAGPVTGGGTIKGHVTLVGTAPKLPPVHCSRDADVCGKSQPDRTLLVGPGGGLENAIVSLTDIHAGKAPPAKLHAKLDIKQCAYTPRVQAVPLGTSLIVGNADPIPHDLNGARGDRVLFNKVVLRDQERVDMSVPGMLTIGCDMHEGHGSCETGVVGVMPNPYFAVTSADGSFSLGDVPPGTYTLQAWHETLGDQSQRVTVAANGSVTADFHLGAKGK